MIGTGGIGRMAADRIPAEEGSRRGNTRDRIATRGFVGSRRCPQPDKADDAE